MMAQNKYDLTSITMSNDVAETTLKVYGLGIRIKIMD